MRKLVFTLLAIGTIALPAYSQVQIDKAINLSGSGSDAKVSGIKSVTAAQDAVSVEALQKSALVYAEAAGTTSAYNLTLPAITAYTDGMVLHFKAPVGNASPVTLSVNGMAPVTIKKNVSGNLSVGDILAGQLVTVIYDANTGFFQLTSGGVASSLNGASAPTIGSANQVLGVNSGATGLEYKSLNGTANRVSVTNGVNAVTLSTPQDIHTSASPTFSAVNVTGANVSGLSASSAVYTDGAKNLTSAAPTGGTIGYWSRDNVNGYLYNATLSDRVGVGTATPQAKLDVNGAVATNRNYIYLAGGGDANHAITNVFPSDGEQFRFFNFMDFYQTNGAGNTRLYINGSGNVGIGTTSWSASGARFAVHYNAVADQVMTLRNTSATGLSSVRLEDENGGYMGDIGYDNNNNVLRIGGNAAVSKYFDGNVGIGQLNPGNALVIDGTSPVEEIRSGGYLMMRPSANNWDMRLRSYSDVNNRLDVFSGGDLATPIASFVSGGSVGVGTTTPDSKLDVNGELDFNTVKKQLVFEASTAGNTYLANTWYDIGPAQTLGDNVDGAHYIVGVSVQYNTPVGYHTMIGTGTIGFTSWKNSGVQPGTFMVLDHHNADDVYCYVRGKIGNGARVMQIMFLSNVPINAAGGKVRIFLKRIF